MEQATDKGIRFHRKQNFPLHWNVHPWFENIIRSLSECGLRSCNFLKATPASGSSYTHPGTSSIPMLIKSRNVSAQLFLSWILNLIQWLYSFQRNLIVMLTIKKWKYVCTEDLKWNVSQLFPLYFLRYRLRSRMMLFFPLMLLWRQ